MTRRILITGERDWSNVAAVRSAMAVEAFGGTHFILGDCSTGADKAALEFCRDMRIAYEVHWVDAARPSPRRYHERNQRMVDDKPDEFIAFWSGRTNPSGTLDTMRRCALAGIGGRVVVP